MTFKLQPNPGLYARLAEQWEMDEKTRNEASQWFISNHISSIILVLGIILVFIQTAVIVSRRQKQKRSRLPMYEDEEIKQVTITPSGRWDVKSNKALMVHDV